MSRWTVDRPPEPEPGLPVRLVSYGTLVLTLAGVGAGVGAFYNVILSNTARHASVRREAHEVAWTETKEDVRDRAIGGAIGGAVLGLVLVLSPLPGRARGRA